jgi:hypothetical protein
MSTTRRFPLAMRAGLCGLVAVAALAPDRARADEQILRGPHPFIKDNELTAHVQIVAGIHDTPGGTKVAADYGYRLTGPAWLNLQLNFQRAPCHSPSGASTCDEPSGSIFETLAGVKLKWATPIPLVPYVKGAIGLAYSFPNGAGNTLGFAARGGVGAAWFIFDWLGFGGELGYSVGSMSMPSSSSSSSMSSSSYAELDFGGGVEFQF